MYEAAWTLVFIERDDALATEWRDHDDPTTPFHDARFLTREGLVKLGRSRDDAECKAPGEYRLYSQLKMGAHANPLLEKRLGITRTGADILKGNGPDTSDDGIRAAWFAMLVAVHLSWLAMTGLVQSHLTGKVPDELIARVIAVYEHHEQLGKLFAEKWEQGDPFPGKWRK